MFFTIVTYSYLLLPLCFLIVANRTKDRSLLPLVIYGVLFFCFLNWYEDIPKEARKYSQAIYTFLEYSFFTLFFWIVISNKIFRLIMIVFSLLFIVFQFFYVTTIARQRLDSIPIGIESILLFIYIFYFFFEFSKNTKDFFIYNHYAFWIAIGVLIYLGGSLFFFTLINHLNQSEIDTYGNMTYIAEIIKNVLLCFSIIIFKKHPINTQTRIKEIPNLDMI